MEIKKQTHIFSRNFDLFFIKFPIIFPIIYGLFLYMFPNYENILIFTALMLFAEPHFGATWPFFLNKENSEEIKNKKIRYIYTPILIVFFSLIGFFYVNALFFLIFFAVNIFHVTRQSYGICKLYKSNEEELNYQEKIVYFFNSLFFIVGILRFYVPIIEKENILIMNIIIIFLFLIIFSIYFIKFKNIENLLTLITGSIIFFPICFVDKPIHGIVMGVLMHYTQYLSLTFKVYNGRNSFEFEKNKKLLNMKSLYFLIIIFLYGLIMAIFSSYSNSMDLAFKSLIVIPLIGQFLHFYLDAFLWRFSEKHNRDATLKYLYN